MPDFDEFQAVENATAAARLYFGSFGVELELLKWGRRGNTFIFRGSHNDASAIFKTASTSEKFVARLLREKEANEAAIARLGQGVVAAVLSHNHERNTLVLEDSRGEELTERVTNAGFKPGQRVATCRKAGEWLRRFHDLEIESHRFPYQKFVDDFEALQIPPNGIDASEREAYRGFAAIAYHRARRARGHWFSSGAFYGGFMPRNLFVTEDDQWIGVNLRHKHRKFIFDDILRFLFKLETLRHEEAPAPEFINGHDPKALKAFIDGYGFDFRQDRVFEMFTATELCKLWKQNLKAPLRTDFKERELRRIKARAATIR